MYFHSVVYTIPIMQVMSNLHTHTLSVLFGDVKFLQSEGEGSKYESYDHIGITLIYFFDIYFTSYIIYLDFWCTNIIFAINMILYLSNPQRET